jgi:hypothetical protein
MFESLIAGVAVGVGDGLEAWMGFEDFASGERKLHGLVLVLSRSQILLPAAEMNNAAHVGLRRSLGVQQLKQVYIILVKQGLPTKTFALPFSPFNLTTERALRCP